MSHNNLIYEFGPYQFNPTQRLLRREGEIIALQPKVTDILNMLVSNAGQLVERDELLNQVWPNTFVEEANLTQTIFTLRRALGDERAGPKYIETVTRRGYRFVAPVTKIEANHHTAEVDERVEGQTPVVAVVPFLNATGNPDLEYVAEGVTDNIINNLSRVSKLRVMSRSAVFRHGVSDTDPRLIGKELGAHAVLVGKISARSAGVVIGVELIDTVNGWLLWGESFDLKNKDLLEIQGAITRQLLASLKLKLTGDEEQTVTARYTENAEAYQAYLEGRYHWSRYTRKGIEKAIKHFRHAIELDPNYALAYAGIIDCYLRLATNYLPPEGYFPLAGVERMNQPDINLDKPDSKVRLRFEWDWKGAERELRRANELKVEYPSAHQWYAAYQYSMDVFREASGVHTSSKKQNSLYIKPPQAYYVSLTAVEEVQIFCTVAREQIEVGNYKGGCLMLRKLWRPGQWPNLAELNANSAADLLFTTGTLASCLSSTGQIEKGQKHAEALLSASIGIFEHMGARRSSVEGRIELAHSYYRQGLLELTSDTLLTVLSDLNIEDSDLKCLALIRLGVVERHAGHIDDALSRFAELCEIVEQSEPLVKARYHHELANVLNLAQTKNLLDISETVTQHLQQAFYQFAAIGHHRYTAVVENNLGFQLLKLGRFEEAETHLFHARELFAAFGDMIRQAQVEDTLARLYITTKRFDLAKTAIDKAVAVLERTDEEALFVEALTTRGNVFCKLNRHGEARSILEGACRIAERCGDYESAARALMILVEEMFQQLEESECSDIADRLCDIIKHTQDLATHSRFEQCVRLMESRKN